MSSVCGDGCLALNRCKHYIRADNNTYRLQDLPVRESYSDVTEDCSRCMYSAPGDALLNALTSRG